MEVEEEPGEEEEEQPEEKEEPDQQAEAEFFAAAEVDQMAEQKAILASIQDEASLEANRAFLRRTHAESDALFAELNTEIEAEEAGAKAEAPKLQLPPMLPPPGT
jgi:hypothetical protein